MSQGVYTGKDRRKSVRFRFNARVKVLYDGETFEAQGTDFNDDSIGITHSKEIPEGAAVTLWVVDELGNEVEFGGEVARTGPAQEPGFYAMVIRRTDQGDS